jgi:alpha-galactosidase
MDRNTVITFIGAGSTIFLKNIVGDILLQSGLSDAHIKLYDIDAERLKESRQVIDALNAKLNGGRATISAFLGRDERREALRGADFAVNTIQVGGYRPATLTDFEVPKRFGLRQTIGDTLGIGGIFRGLRTIPVMLEIVREMEEVCPDALLLNYTNPMAILTGAIQRASRIASVGLCHSVQVCVPHLLESLDMTADDPVFRILGINHMSWLLEIRDGKRDLYPEIKKRAAEKNRKDRHDDMVRFEMMRYFGYYTTESSEHLSEYTPYWIRKDAPELIERFNIPLDEYLRRCEKQISDWNERKEELRNGLAPDHVKSNEYGADIIKAVATGIPSVSTGISRIPQAISRISPARR